MQSLNEALEALLERSVEEAVDYLNTFLIQCMTGICAPQDWLRTATERLHMQEGTSTVAAMADAAAVSSRHLERGFGQTVGIAPKALAQRIRFERVRDHLWRDPHASLAIVAAEYGYADQAHLSREFKRYSQRTPRQFAAEMLETRTLLQGQDVGFVQDG